jgi:hypothetical protein
MTREFNVVSPEMWSDARFVALGDDAKLLWVRLLTGPEASALPGLIVSGRLALAEAMGWSPKKFDRAFADLSKQTDEHEHPMAVADWPRRVVWLPQAQRHRRRPKNPNEVLSWRDFWKIVPDCELKRQHAGKLRPFLSQLGDSFATAFDSYSVHSDQPKCPPSQDPCRGTSGEQGVEQEGEQTNVVPARARARARSDSPSHSDSSSSPRSTPVPPSSAPGGLTPPPETLELTQALKDECVMNGWPEPNAEHVRKFLLNARSKGQVFADWTARFKWWMSEEKKRMGRDRPYQAGGEPPSARKPRTIPEVR